MQKRVGKRYVFTSLFEIFLLITVSFAIAFFLRVDSVSAAPGGSSPATGSGASPSVDTSAAALAHGVNPNPTPKKIPTDTQNPTGGFGGAATAFTGITGVAKSSTIKLASPHQFNLDNGQSITSSQLQKVGNDYQVVGADGKAVVGADGKTPLTLGQAEKNTLINNGELSVVSNSADLSNAGWKVTSATSNGLGLADKTVLDVPTGGKILVSPDEKTAALIDSNNNVVNTAKWDPTANGGQGAWNIASGATPAAPEQVQFIGGTFGGFSPLINGLLYAGVAYGAIQLLSGMLGFSKSTTSALSVAAFAGIMTWKGLETLGGAGGLKVPGLLGNNFLTRNAGLVGIGVAVLVFLLMYKTEKQKVVMFQCLPYEPPIGGAKCEQCNADPFRPCSEYRCKSLGQTCELLNKGNLGKEVCARVDPKDPNSPTIAPLASALYPFNLKYIEDTSVRPPALGVKIVSNAADGCLQAFTPLKFGVATNKPAQCKIDYNHTASFDAMQFYFGEENYYEYNHTQTMKLPAPESNQNNSASPLFQNGGTFSLYVRCRDANGNANVDEYSVSYCVSKSPDTTPPVIQNTSILSGSPVTYNSSSVPIQVFTNEPADCRWSRQDKAYASMENNMTCGNNGFNFNSDLLFACSGNLTGIKNMDDNQFYFRCLDQPGKAAKDRNPMTQSYPLLIRGSQPLNIVSASPNGTISGSTSTVPVELGLTTSNGAEEGKAVCYFSVNRENSDSFIEMVNTSSFTHSQELDLVAGNYQYFFRCIDAGGNIDYANTSFTVAIDKQAPIVTRVYRDTDALKVVTNEDAQCVYSLTTCNYNFDEGIKMIYNPSTDLRNSFTQWKPTQSYYIKCKDSYDNEPDPNACSVIASAIDLTGTTQ